MKPRFNKAFTQQLAIPEAGIAVAVELMRSGRLHRYNTIGDTQAEASVLEQEYAQYQGSQYCLACTSGGYALQLALKAAGLEAGDAVLCNGFTLAPVPGAIDNAGGKVVLVEIDANYCIDLVHLEQQARASAAKFLLLSHMRGHIADMHAIVKLCQDLDIILIEDCAHTMGARWDGTRSGNFGAIACFSTQSYKHLNSGEGGLLTTDDPKIAARATLLSGSYMLYERHGTQPDAALFDALRWLTPNYSGRMDNLRAAILRAQLPLLEDNALRWNSLHDQLATALSSHRLICLPHRDLREAYVASSIQFRLPDCTAAQIGAYIERCAARGVELKWFGAAAPQGFTSRYDSWRYLGEIPCLTTTLEVLSTTLDMRIPLSFDAADMALIGRILTEEVDV